MNAYMKKFKCISNLQGSLGGGSNRRFSLQKDIAKSTCWNSMSPLCYYIMITLCLDTVGQERVLF